MDSEKEITIISFWAVTFYAQFDTVIDIWGLERWSAYKLEFDAK